MYVRFGLNSISVYAVKDINVRPWVARNTPCRDERTIKASSVSLSRVFDVIVDVSCSSAISPMEVGVQPENYGSLGHAVDRFICGPESRFSSFPCSVLSIGSSTIVGAIVQSFYQHRTQIQALTT